MAVFEEIFIVKNGELYYILFWILFAKKYKPIMA